MEDFISTEDLSHLDEDETPRMILVASNFRVGVTNTVLWLTRNTDLDLTCVQLVPFESAGQTLLASQVLLPLPQAAAYEVRLREKRRVAQARKAGTKLDLDAAKDFIASIPEGRWATYGDVAAAAGNPKAPQPVGTWLRNTKDDIPNVYRVLNRHGEVSEGWVAEDPNLPPTPDGVRQLLKADGVTLDADGRADQTQRWTVAEWQDQLDSASRSA